MTITNSILVTAIGSFSTSCVIDSLKLNFKENKIIGSDIYPAHWHANSPKFNAVYQVSKIDDSEDYLKDILKICVDENIELIIPLTDLEIDYFNTKRSLFSQRGIVLGIPSEEVLHIARNKFNLHNFFLEDIEVPSINTFKSGSTQDYTFPVIGKPVNGRSSEGIMIATNQQELEILNKKSDYIIQEIIQGPVFTVDYIRNSQFKSQFGVVRKELIRTKNGAGLTVEIQDNKDLQKLVYFIGEKLEINGCVNMEFILNNNQYYLIDINPRFSAGVAFSRLAGYDMVGSHVNCFYGKNINPPVKIKGMVAIKHMTEIISNIYPEKCYSLGHLKRCN